jgi:hypothetical protein
MVVGKAILLIIEGKIKEKLSLLIEATQSKGGVCSSENMVYLFCCGLFTSNCVKLDTVNELRRQQISDKISLRRIHNSSSAVIFEEL